MVRLLSTGAVHDPAVHELPDKIRVHGCVRGHALPYFQPAKKALIHPAVHGGELRACVVKAGGREGECR